MWFAFENVDMRPEDLPSMRNIEKHFLVLNNSHVATMAVTFDKCRLCGLFTGVLNGNPSNYSENFNFFTFFLGWNDF